MPKLIPQRQPKQMRVLAGGVAAAAGSTAAPAPSTGAAQLGSRSSSLLRGLGSSRRDGKTCRVGDLGFSGTVSLN